MTRCNEGATPIEWPIYAVRSWPWPLRAIVHIVMAILGSIRQSPYPSAGQADLWCNEPAWKRYLKWHRRNWFWDLRADILGTRWWPEHWWTIRERVRVTRVGGYCQELTLRVHCLFGVPLLPFVAWRSDDGRNWPGLYGIPDDQWRLPWLPARHRWHIGWQDGRVADIQLRTHGPWWVRLLVGGFFGGLVIAAAWPIAV